MGPALAMVRAFAATPAPQCPPDVAGGNEIRQWVRPFITLQTYTRETEDIRSGGSLMAECRLRTLRRGRDLPIGRARARRRATGIPQEFSCVPRRQTRWFPGALPHRPLGGSRVTTTSVLLSLRPNAANQGTSKCNTDRFAGPIAEKPHVVRLENVQKTPPLSQGNGPLLKKASRRPRPLVNRVRKMSANNAKWRWKFRWLSEMRRNALVGPSFRLRRPRHQITNPFRNPRKIYRTRAPRGPARNISLCQFTSN